MLFQLARIAAEPAEFTKVDLVAVARRTAAEQVPTALKHGCDIAFEEPGGAQWVQGSETAIGVALSNLIRNAVYHAETGRPILIEVAAPARLRVIDAGRGLQVREPERLFDAFRRGNTRAEGVGLGLSIVFQVMTMHQGSVAIRETPGGGTTVELTFPIEQGHATSTTAEQDEFHWKMPMGESLPVK
jgi:signal transduction histidine kinase